MALTARDLMTTEPAFCTPETPLDQVAKLMVRYNCGEIPVIDPAERPVGVVTDRDIVCRVVAELTQGPLHDRLAPLLDDDELDAVARRAQVLLTRGLPLPGDWHSTPWPLV